MRNPVGVRSQSFSGVRASTALINTNNPAERKYHPLLSVPPKHATLLLHIHLETTTFREWLQ